MSIDYSLSNITTEQQQKKAFDDEIMFVRMACESLCRVAEQFNLNGKHAQADKALAFSLSLAPGDAATLLCRSRILAARGQQAESDAIRTRVTTRSPWVARLETINKEEGSWIRVRRDVEEDLIYGEYEDSPQGLLCAMECARSESGHSEYKRGHDPIGMTIERCSGTTQILGYFGWDGKTVCDGLFDSGGQSSGPELVFTQYHWPNLSRRLESLNSDQASQILLIVQQVDALLKNEVNKMDVTELVEAAMAATTEPATLLYKVFEILDEECEYEKVTHLRKKLHKYGLKPLPTKEAVILLKKRLYEAARVAAENTYPAIQGDLEGAGFFAEAAIVEDLTLFAAPKIARRAREYAISQRSATE